MAGKRPTRPTRVETILGRIRTYRFLVLPIWDGLALVVGGVVARGLIDTSGRSLWFIWTLTISVLLSCGTIVGLYRGRWAVASFSEMCWLAGSFAASTIVVVATHALGGATRADGFALLLALTSFIVSATGRALWRIWYERSRRPVDAKRVVVVVAGEAGVQLVRGMLLDPAGAYVPVAVLDDDPLHQRRSMMGVPVGGALSDVVEVARRYEAEAVVVGATHLPSAILNMIVVNSRAADLEVLVYPGLGPSDNPDSSASDIRPITPLDLLRRREISADWEAVTAYLRGKRVLVTGAGGSIGSELCRQIAKAAPAILVKLDRDESALQQTELSIDGHGLLTDPTLVVADIRDAHRLIEVFRQFSPEIVFHAAALKHLSLLEMHPSEAVKTNVDGTLKVISACADSGVACFVNISTDKAAHPTSVLGYSKRVSERITSTYAKAVPDAKYLSVRFGNVVGSRGSVIHAFRSQAAKGGPITVTHPDVTRFFMTVEEAVLLVIQAGGIGESGEVLILDMGSPVSIDEVAQRVAQQTSPPVNIVYTGLRPGEKMHEDLFGEGEVDERPKHPLISHVPVPPLSIGSLEQLRHGFPDEVRERLAFIVGAEAAKATVMTSVVADERPFIPIGMPDPEAGWSPSAAVGRGS